MREFLYTDDLSPEGHIDCLGVIEIGNRFCLPRLVKLVEASVVEELMMGASQGEDILEEVLDILEPAQVNRKMLKTFVSFFQISVNLSNCVYQIHFCLI